VSVDLVLGIDLGTSGVRCCAVDESGRLLGMAAAPMAPPRQLGAAVEQDPTVWWEATVIAIRSLGRSLNLGAVRRVAVDGTSGTLLLINAHGCPRSQGLMYNDARSVAAATRIKAVAPPESGAHGASAALAKLLHLVSDDVTSDVRYAVHQADWIAGRLTGHFGVSDENNALKLGYDPVARDWPQWFDALGVPRRLLPTVRIPGSLLGLLHRSSAEELGLQPGIDVRLGTTDGVAAFLATRGTNPGDAVTSLGSTLVVKLLSDRPLFAPAQGVYSHRLGDRWLAGGASNSGGAALLVHFTAEHIAELTPQLRPNHPTGLNYYPLPAPGERFPFADPAMPPRVSPRPQDDAEFLQGLLEGIAGIEALAFSRLRDLGAPPLRRVITIGGGARNSAWQVIRERQLGVPVTVAECAEAAYGTALLALYGGPP
jgi:sugar (pentulose or hexulose) kinase